MDNFISGWKCAESFSAADALKEVLDETTINSTLVGGEGERQASALSEIGIIGELEKDFQCTIFIDQLLSMFQFPKTPPSVVHW